MLTILNVCFFAEQLLTLHIGNVAYVMVVLNERFTNGCINAWLKLATKERKQSVLRPFE
jgi:hypothetical protein